MYQLSALGKSVIAAQSWLCCIQPASAWGVGSMVVRPSLRSRTRQSLTQSTCCSIDTIMFDSTDGLPGPVIMKKLGKPTDIRPR